MLAPSSSSSSSIYPWKYDIFLSFRGEDSRKSFTDHLYVALKQSGINTFRDDNNLKRGEDIAPELLKAIGESWGSIIVFSKGYALSSWCLDELAEIVKQREERGHQVFPIFYDVEVSDLRHQRQRVQEAFDMHEKRYKENKDKTQRWRDALSQVANISGWILKDQ
ncbi:TMV resistance protein N-like [Durio zibethinus]|uniref:TMV resistance protein N-like n=1 Tax=Durio zibethinus TaxID=66656 RepID=A0A6P5WMR6_DURZI|nr:TMV resistance protein N-like [Durio zibethinus]